jgi:leucyl aminopeptidase
VTDFLPQFLGDHGPLRFRAAQWDAVEAPVDLLVAGLWGKGKGGALSPELQGLDRVLHGALRHLCARAIFHGDAGEALTLSSPPPPIKARSLMLVGLGPAAPMQVERIEHAMEQAMQTALCTQAISVACFVGWSEIGIGQGEGASTCKAIAQAMMRGALLALDRPANLPERRLDWTFAVGGEYQNMVIEALRNTLQERPDPDANGG